MKVIGVHLDRCLGCKTCELYCAVERGSNGKTLWKAVQEHPLPQARVRVEGTTNFSFPLQCRHCLKAPCLDACLTGALTRDAQSGLVMVKEDTCIACWTCIMFCPYGVIYPWPERKFALKCDRCAFMEKPICIDVCPCQALELVELEELAAASRQKRKEIAQQISENKKGLIVLDLA